MLDWLNVSGRDVECRLAFILSVLVAEKVTKRRIVKMEIQEFPKQGFKKFQNQTLIILIRIRLI